MKKNNSFWKTTKRCYEEVQKWPKWKRQYIISADAASTGRFIRYEYINNK